MRHPSARPSGDDRQDECREGGDAIVTPEKIPDEVGPLIVSR